MEDNTNISTEEVVKEEVGTQANENKDEVKAAKTFSQEEVNAMIKKEKDKVTNKYKDIDIEGYNNWKESQKTAEEKQAEKDAEYQRKDTELSQVKMENLVLRSGVTDIEDVDYIIYKVSKMEGEFSENLAKFLENNKKFTEKELNRVVATGAPVQQTTTTKNSVSNILKNRHPELF